MPATARVSELTLDDDKIELRIESPTPAFDGKLPVPFGDRSFDEYGVADMDWRYPRDDPGFGCRTGEPLAAVRAALTRRRRGWEGDRWRTRGTRAARLTATAGPGRGTCRRAEQG